MCGGGKLPGTDIIKKWDPLRGGDVILDKLGLPSVLGDKHGIMNGNEPEINETGSTAIPQETNVAEEVQSARASEKRRRAAASGMSSTILGGGTAGTTTGAKTLLGQ
ncbi:hypothetical protein ACYZT4_11005 [Pseudomonas sp. GB2N2]